MIFKSLTLRSAVLFLLLAVMSLDSQAAQADRSREEFAAAMAKIKEGTPESEVLALLGKPDDIRTKFDPGGISRVGTKEIWCYDAKGHLGFPTLGCIYIDENGRSQEVFGGQGQPPKPGLFKEEELRELLCILDTTPEPEGYFHYNPLLVIRIVNTLQPLGAEKASAAIGEYIRVSDEFAYHREGIFLVLRVLFDVPETIDPNKVGLGMPSPAYPKDPHQIPRFPVALVDDIPLMLAGGYSYEGSPISMEDVLEFFKVNGRLHPQPLTPSKDPLGALKHLMKSSQWIYADRTLQDPYSMKMTDMNDGEKDMIREQLLRLIDSVYRLPANALGDRLPCPCGGGESSDSAWKRYVGDVAALKIKWDTKQNEYVFQDGTHLPDVEKKLYQRSIWKLTGLGYDEAELTLERTSDSYLDILVNSSQKAGAPLRTGTLSIFAGDGSPPLLTSEFTEESGTGGGSKESHTVTLKAGTKLRARLVINGNQTNWSPVFEP